MGGLQEVAAQRFDDFSAARGIENVGKHPQGRRQIAGISLGVAGFEPATT